MAQNGHMMINPRFGNVRDMEGQLATKSDISDIKKGIGDIKAKLCLHKWMLAFILVAVVIPLIKGMMVE